MPGQAPRQNLGQVQAVSSQPLGPGGLGQLRPPAGGDGLEPAPQLVKEPANLATLVGLHRAELLVELCVPGLLRPEGDPLALFELGEVDGAGKGRGRLGLDSGELLRKLLGHDTAV